MERWRISLLAVEGRPKPLPSPRVQRGMTRTIRLGSVLALASALPLLTAADAPTRAEVASRLRADPAAAEIALRLLDRDGVVVDVEGAHRMDGGFRGQIAIVPALPTGAERAHLAWADAAFHDYDDLFAALAPRAPHEQPVSYRFHAISLRYFRSVGRTTPSAYASADARADGFDFSIAYNVDGSLMTSATAVRETLFHEIFHLNDEAHGDWSARALKPIFDAIVAKCAARTACLAPYAPSTTMVRGGTYYAFYPGNGVGEYGAELALRYYREQRAVVHGERLGGAPFKCGPKENARAWGAIVDEMFGGIDRTTCGAGP